MTNKIPFDVEWLKEHISYCPDSGEITLIKKWKAKTTRSVSEVGTILGHLDGRGYKHFSMLGKKYKVHRIAWMYMTGNYPELQVDHINGDRLDNRFCNLRLVTNSQNQGNRRKILARSGYKGVYPLPTGKWTAQYNKIHLGVFDTTELAAKAYDKYVIENLGEYAAPNCEILENT